MGATFAALRTQVGVAKETTRGTPVTATAFPAVKKFDPVLKQLKAVDNGWRGSMGKDYGQQNTTRYADLDISGDVFLDTIGWMLGSILGADTTTGTGPFVHTFALQNTTDGQPTSQTWVDNEGGIQGRQYPGAQCTDLTFKFDTSGLMTYDAKYMSFIGSTVATPTASYSALTPVPDWLGVVNIGGSANLQVETMEINLKRDNPEAVFTLGAQDPYSVHVGGLQVMTKFTFIAQDESRLTSFVNNTQEAVTVTFTQVAVNQILKFQMSQHFFTDAKVVRSKAYMGIDGSGLAMLNSTDATAAGGGLSPIQVVLTNGVAAATYI